MSAATEERKRERAVDPKLKEVAKAAWEAYRLSYRGATEETERRATFRAAVEAEMAVAAAETSLDKLFAATAKSAA